MREAGVCIPEAFDKQPFNPECGGSGARTRMWVCGPDYPPLLLPGREGGREGARRLATLNPPGRPRASVATSCRRRRWTR